MSDQPELLSALRAHLRDERGLTLVELLIATVAALIVSVAVLAIVIVSVHLGSNYTDRVDANQQGRLAMEKITQQLYSSCVTPDQAPVLAGSTATQLTFYSALNDKPGPVPNQITISGPSSTTTPTALTMSTQLLSGTPPNWVATNQAPTVFTLASWATQSTQSGTAVPLFQYYPYGSSGIISTTPFTLGSSGLTAAQAAATAMVQINYQVWPTDKWSATHRPVDFSDSVSFRLTPPSSAPNASNLPCT